jgi:hypothetical protein
VPAERVFIVGANRSGTTWLQQLLGGHPRIVTPHETELFFDYVASWRRIWDEQLPTDPERWRQRRHRGLPAVLTEEAFSEVLLEFVGRVDAELLRLKPSAEVVVEKALGVRGELILDLLPASGFIHIIRDGRDASASMLRASRGWGSHWAPRSGEWAAYSWRRATETGRAISALTDRYVEIRYEALQSEAGPEILLDLFRFCGVEADEKVSTEIYSRFSLDTSANGKRPSSIVWGGEVARRIGAGELEPDGFAGAGGVGAWRRDLRLDDRLLFDSVAGDLLCALGYENDRGWIGAGHLRRFAARVPLALSWRASRLRHSVAARIAGEGRNGAR